MPALTLMDILSYIFDVCVATCVHLFLLVGIGFILGFYIHMLSRAIAIHASGVFPVCVYARLFVMPGSALHEISHYLFAKLFGLKVYEVVLFQCKPGNPYGGYVRSSEPTNFVQKIGLFFIGIGPIVLGSLAIHGLSHFFLGPGLFSGVALPLEFGNSLDLLDVVGRLLQSVILAAGHVFGQLVSLRGVPGWQVWLFLYLAYSIANAMNLSASDLRSMVSGLTVIAAILLVINMLLMSGGNDLLLPYIVKLREMYSTFYTIMLFALSLNLLAAIIVVPLGIMFRRTV